MSVLFASVLLFCFNGVALACFGPKLFVAAGQSPEEETLFALVTLYVEEKTVPLPMSSSSELLATSQISNSVSHKLKSCLLVFPVAAPCMSGVDPCLPNVDQSLEFQLGARRSIPAIAEGSTLRENGRTFTARGAPARCMQISANPGPPVSAARS